MDTPRPSAPSETRTVGRYEILREAGRGGMAIVHLARQTDLDRYVALKELAGLHTADPSLAHRFLRESRVAGSLNHPNIVAVHDYFEWDGTPFIAMEYLDRGSLRPWVANLTPPQVIGVLEGVLAGLDHAEQHHVVHRDLKPENLMVSADGRVKIADFGIAKARDHLQTSALLTATGMTVGTPTYMAPEQAMAQEIGPWTDLYSVGIMAYEFYAGRTPFHGTESPVALLLRHVNEDVPPLRSAAPDVAPELSDWVGRLLAKDPAARTRSAVEAWEELEDLAIGLLGPRWRRQARLAEGARPIHTPKPLTPAPFEGTSEGPRTPPADVAVPSDSDWVTFAPRGAPEGAAGRPDPGPAPEPPRSRVTPAAGPAPAPSTPAAPPAPTAEPRAPAVPTAEQQAPAPTAPQARAGPPPSGHRDVAPEPAPRPAAREATVVPGFETYAPASSGRRSAPAPPPPPQPDAAAVPTPPAPAPAPAPRAANSGGAPSPAPGTVPAAGDRDAGWGAPTLAPRTVPDGRAAGSGRRPVRGRAPRPGGRARRLAALGAVTAAAAAAGLLAAGSGGDPVAPEVTLAADRVSLRAPAGWTVDADPPDLPGLALQDRTAASGDGGSLIAGLAGAADHPSLLPAAFRAALGQAPAPGRPVRLGSRLQALRYDGLLLPGPERRPVRLFAAPTDGGVATVACVAVPAAQCDGAAASLRLDGLRPLPVGPDPVYAAGLSPVLETLGRSAAREHARLRSARTPDGQARIAGQLAQAHADAAAAVEALRAPSVVAAAHERLGSALDAAAGAYRRLRRAAAAGDRERYAGAGAAAGRAQRSARAALDGIAAAGYRVR